VPAKWEYRRVVETAEGEILSDLREVVGDAQQRWIDGLNALGADGWELISERFVSGEYLSGKRYAQYSGTMKREAA
jgi:hypothetical protein